MNAPVVVGYTATTAGADAVVLGSRLARTLGSSLHLVIVLPHEGTRSAAVPPERSYEEHLRDQAAEWLRAAVELVPNGIASSGHVRFDESFAAGLVAAGEEFGAGVIVIGAANGGRFGFHRLGSVASQLLHSSSIPVALAPTGTADAIPATQDISRVTVAIGTRAGADELLETSVRLATRSDVPLRLLSLATLDVPPGLDTGAIRLVDSVHSDDVLRRAREALPIGVTAEVESAVGDSIEEAVTLTAWQSTEIAVVGSSRLAQPRRLFLGSTAAKMLHELPVPMIVVPRTRPEGA